MKIRIVAFGIAKDILQSSSLSLELESGTKISELRNKLISDFPEFEKLRSLKFAVNEDYRDEDFKLEANDEVVIIPPVSGG